MKYFFTLLFAILFVTVASAQNDIFIKIVDAAGNQVPGELAGPGRHGYIAATSLGQENINCTDIMGGACAGKPGNFIFNTLEMQPINALKKLLFTADHLSHVEISFRKAGGTQYEYYEVIMQNVLVKNIKDACTATSFNHQVELQAGRVGWTFYNSSGVVVNKFGWDYTTNSQWNF